jgi:hypothetical protein
VVGNKQTYLRNPETGKRVARVRDAGERIVAELPELRVVDQKLWDAVQALKDPQARTEAADILRTLIERVTLQTNEDGHVVGLTGDIVKLLTLPGSHVPASFESSVKVVAGTCFDRDLKCQC